MTNSALKLAILVHDLSATGVVRNAIRIAGHIANLGQRTELWVVRQQGNFLSQLPLAVKVRKISSPAPKGFRRLETMAAVPHLAREIVEQRPRVLLSAGNHFHLAGGLAFRRASRPDSVCFMGRASNAPPHLSAPGLADMALALDALKYREMRKVIAVSEELATSLEQRLHIPPERLAVIPNGVDLAATEALASEPLEDPWYAADAPPVIVSAGRLVKQKNFPLLIDAFAFLRRKMAARLIIIGEGSEKARTSLQRQADDRKISPDFRLQGFVANPMPYFAKAGLFVLSSRYEGASNVLLEAMACGCPVVAADCPTGVREQMDDGRMGPLVPLDDAEAMADAMARRLITPRNSPALKEQAARFDQAKMLGSYERLFAPCWQ